MLKRRFLYCFLLFVLQIVQAQKETTFWYFGNNAGLDFSTGRPVSTRGSLVTEEGCASISNAKGELLFYTDGITVWNRNHDPMPNGDETLKGHPSSSQSGIIVPKPDEPGIYYVFTVDDQGDTDEEHGLNYYTVDMSLDDGRGDLVTIDGLPAETNLIEGPTTEKITAVKVFRENAFWVTGYKDDKFYVFKVDEFGVHSEPVVGNTGFVSPRDRRGYLKISPNGKVLVSANMSSGLFVYDFDSSTGMVSNERRLDVEGNSAYGVEFSPLSKRLYISTGERAPPGDTTTEVLYQFSTDINDPTEMRLNATRSTIHEYQNGRAALQVGLDGKIYRSRSGEPFLGVINNPDANGLACDYIHNGVRMANLPTEGLPPFVQTFFIGHIEVANQCLGDETQFKIITDDEIESASWHFGPRGSEKKEGEETSFVYQDPGEYRVTLTLRTENHLQTLTHFLTIHESPVINTPVVLKQCDIDSDGLIDFNLTESELLIGGLDETINYRYYITEDDAINETNEISDPTVFSNEIRDKIFVRVENFARCYSIAEVDLEVSIVSSAIPPDFKIPYSACDSDEFDGDANNGITTFDFSSATEQILDFFPDQNLSVSYHENFEDAVVVRNPIDSENYRNTNSPFFASIFVRVVNSENNDCVGIGQHVDLITMNAPQFDLKEEDQLCLDQGSGTMTIQAENEQGNYTYEWRSSNGDVLSSGSSSLLDVSSGGQYFLTAFNNNSCQLTKSINLLESNIAKIERIEVIEFSENNSITIHVSGKGIYEYSLDNIFGPYQDENYFEGLYGGEYTVYVKDKNGCGIQSQKVAILDIPKFFTPNHDGVNDTWQIGGVNLLPNSKVYIFDKFGKVLTQIDPMGSGWDGNYNGRAMPPSDYWYRAQLDDGRVYKGHFSLIRK